MSGILLVSNGYGEAAIAGYIAHALRARDATAQVDHFPLVGRDSNGVGPQADMPSGGLIAYWNAGNIARDVRAGLVGLTLRQFAFLRAQRGRDAVVAVGDIYCLASALTFARRPTIFVATAKSEYVSGHSAFEAAIARRAALVFARDDATARALAARGVRARYAGNLMMDGVAPGAANLQARSDALRVAVLPGSRADAPANAAAAVRRLALLADAVSAQDVQAFISVAPGAQRAPLIAAVERAAGAQLEPRAAPPGVIAQARRARLEIDVVAGAFGDILASSTIAFGQAGTANEQAAGSGLPVIASGTPGRVGWYRMRQQRLLGDALLVLPDDDRAFVAGVVRLLADPARMQAMAQAGRSRMGAAGASDAVAEAVLALASHKSG
ncbi:MAG: hypothetical protein JO194_08160 [Candidatus Eremiobacteraeota bacterium]|nr:hypothetical protein [Candidatus Eremiobacteraeota bacterium]